MTERECYEWFWSSISMDETYSKDFLESLYQMMDVTTAASFVEPEIDSTQHP